MEFDFLIENYKRIAVEKAHTNNVLYSTQTNSRKQKNK